MYYCNSRISSIEKNVQRQNDILTNFITNVKGDIGNQSVPSTSNYAVSSNGSANLNNVVSEPSRATPEAIHHAKQFDPNKIDVSDDEKESSKHQNSDSEESDSEESDSEESDSEESDSEESTCDENIDKTNIEKNIMKH